MDTINAFVTQRGKEVGSPLGDAVVMVSHLHKEAHGECWVCRYEDFPCTTLRAVASGFAGHDDYNGLWALDA